MGLNRMTTATATTARRPNIAAGQRGAHVAHLSGVTLTPPMLSSATGNHQIVAALGLEGTGVQLWEAYAEAQTHTDDSVETTGVPDIAEGDTITVNGLTYAVRWARVQPATGSFGATLMLYITEEVRA